MCKLKKFSVCIFIVIFSMSFFGCNSKIKEKVFSKDGISITLTEEFEEKEYYDFNAYYDTEDAQVYIMKESFELLKENDQPTDISLVEYAEIMMETQNLNSKVEEKDGLTSFYYEKSFLDYDKNTVDYLYFAVVFKSDDAYWLLQFACEKNLYGEYEEKFVKWAKSVEFD